VRRVRAKPERKRTGKGGQTSRGQVSINRRPGRRFRSFPQKKGAVLIALPSRRFVRIVTSGGFAFLSDLSCYRFSECVAILAIRAEQQRAAIPTSTDGKRPDIVTGRARTAPMTADSDAGRDARLSLRLSSLVASRPEQGRKLY
jgi:hypothetical protein